MAKDEAKEKVHDVYTLRKMQYVPRTHTHTQIVRADSLIREKESPPRVEKLLAGGADV